MPCWTIISSKVEFKTSTDVALLTKALKQLGLSVNANENTLNFSGRLANGTYIQSGSYAIATGKMDVQSASAVDMNMFKRAYSEQIVRYTAQRFGWTVAEKGQNKFEVQRRF